jgi:hypothetical protein
MIAKIVKAQKLHLTIFFRDRLSSKKKLISLYIMVIAYMSTKSIKKNIREPEAYIEGENPTATLVNNPERNATERKVPNLRSSKEFIRTSKITISINT